jgi:hypothetical protein
MNAKAFPGTTPLVAKASDRVRIRLGNLSAMDHHPIHLHGHYFKVTATDGGRIPVAAQWPEATVLVSVGTTRDLEFIADAPGDWPLHCHMTHHVMNQMGHGIPNRIGVKPRALDEQVQPLLPGYMTMGQDGMGDMGDMGMPVPKNSIPMGGAHGPRGYISMGGMFTLLKVRDGLSSYVDPGWYEGPPGELANLASDAELKRDAIAVNATASAAASSPTSPRPVAAPAMKAADKPAPESVYSCPMHPEIVRNAPGKCPICGMNLVKRESK